MPDNTVTRRMFIAGSGVAAVGVAFGAWKWMGEERAQASTGVLAAEPISVFNPIAWVSIASDNTVTIYSPAAEMGQGTMTSLPRVLAEELEVDWNTVRVEQSPVNPGAFGNPGFGGAMVTGSSRTVRGYYLPLRLAGLQAKLVLVQAAADIWGVPPTEILAEKSVLTHASSNRRMTYGELAKVATAPATLPVVDKSMLKPMSAFTIIGKDVPRVDVPSKSDGSAIFGIDVRLPGMLWAAVKYAEVQGEKPLSVDVTKAEAVSGVRKIITLPYGVAVVADSFVTARTARDLLAVTWTQEAPGRSYDSDRAMTEYVTRAKHLTEAGTAWSKRGDAQSAIDGAARTMSATYLSAHVAQVTLEPMNCTAWVQGDRIEIWAPSQIPSGVLGVAVQSGFRAENVKVNITLLGGGYGRRAEVDFAIDAVLIAKQMPDIPVQVIWTREDDFQRSKPRPMTAQHLTAGLDADGRIVGWRHRITSEGATIRLARALYDATGGKDPTVMKGSENVYDIPNQLAEHLPEKRGIDVGYWRGVGPSYTKFAAETLVDDIAVQLKKDPLQYRLDMLSASPRAQAVLRRTAAMANYPVSRGAGRALGLAFSDAYESFIAMIVDVSIVEGKIVVHEVWAAVDCGHAISPANIKTQIEGSALYGLSAALGEKLDYKAGQVQQQNLHGYPILRSSGTPLVNVEVIPTDNPPEGIGEVGLPPLAPAVANAIAQLTGRRIHTLPFPATV
ncbi:xanthine dehydrogenase family protein molybdopterin-binding subunit [Pigmentiphaga litoralis]|uniref:Isoquinoline 1-oxidoreductase beta subunit n=1 Tax=Pigmentiphaga litoralis TaxID=516702 RepID=A0A7Y9IRP9_9BURK|nr:molybdopterin cofactor-binding domain-containing protein [Pigmentiphaga litoralis]NYE24629.1 isoquinoline 1-oxidoreductase beta subunit [Pigmentiphaga litoralis]NYE81757.1 isoquinoline 1-oxidoreductase beta subunit [Pigmentiphaga litoralis]